MSRIKLLKDTYANSNDNYENGPSNYDYSMGGNIKFLTPSKYRLAKRAQLPNVFPQVNTDDDNIILNKGEYTLTPSKYRMKRTTDPQLDHDYENFNHYFKKESQPDTQRENPRRIPDVPPRVVGEFTLTKKPPEDKSIYNYKPKHTPTSYIYKGTLDPSEVHERAKNRMQQITQQRSRTSSASPVHGLSYINVFPVPNDINNEHHSTSDQHLHMHRSPRKDEKNNNERANSSFNPLHQHNQSFPTRYPRSSSLFDGKHTPRIPISLKTRYYFGEKAESATSSDDDSSSKDQSCVVFSRSPQPQSSIPQSAVIRQLSEHENKLEPNNIVLHEVIDIGTSTDEVLSDPVSTPIKAKKRLTTLSKQRSSFTNQSSRSDSETYKVNHPDVEEKDYEEVMIPPWKTTDYPADISVSTTSTAQPFTNAKKSVPSKNNNNKNDNNFIRSVPNTDDDGDVEDRFQSTPKPSPDIGEIIQNNPLVGIPRSHYGLNNDNRQAASSISTKSTRSRTIPKPPTLPSQKTDISQDFSSKHNIPRPISTSPTGIDPELIGITTNFRPSERFRRTPGPYPHYSGYESREGDDDSEEMQPSRNTNTSKIDSKKLKSIDESTQSEEKSTRNVGTMHEPVETRNFGNEVQPQSSATQTSLSLKEKPSKPGLTFLERSDQRQTTIDESYSNSRISSRLQQPCREDFSYRPHDRIPYECPRRRTPSPPPLSPPPPPQTTVYYYDSRFKDHSSYRPTTSQYRTRTPSPQRRPQSPTRRRRPQMRSQETDTSLDAMKHQQHAGVQYDPRSTHERGTTPSLRSKKQISNYRPVTPDTTLYSSQPYPTSSRHHSPQSFHLQSSKRNDYYHHEHEEEEEEERPIMHDKSTMAELIVSFDHYTQCDSGPFMADRYIQTTPTVDDDEQRNPFEYSDESDIRQLPRRTSTYIPQPIIIQPDTLPRPLRSRYSPTRPKRDGLDYTGNILEVSLHRGHQQQTTPISGSPLLHIGTENVIPQSSTDEYTIPFETRYIHDSLQSRSRNNSPFNDLIPDSPRTQLFSTSSPIRQSKSNGNFYLTTAPTRSLNSSFRIDITADDF